VDGRRALASASAALTQRAARSGWRARVAAAMESWLDPLDSVRRRRRAEQLREDLIARRISHARAATEMRRLYERQKGGWLAEALRAPEP
jgi:gamma-polyglutamate synthase